MDSRSVCVCHAYVHDRILNIKLDLLGSPSNDQSKKIHNEVADVLASISEPIDRILTSIAYPIYGIFTEISDCFADIFSDIYCCFSDCFGHVTTCEVVTEDHTANANSTNTDKSSTCCRDFSASAPLSFRFLLLCVLLLLLH